MIDFKEILEYSRKLSEGFLKGKKNKLFKEDGFISIEDQEAILRDLNDKSYWTEREKNLDQIDADREWKNIQTRIYIPQTKKSNYWKYAAAAVILFGIALGSYQYAPWDSFLPVNEKSNHQIIVSGSDKAVLTLDDGKEIELAENTSFNSKDANLANNNLLYTPQETTSEVKYNTLTIPRGGKFQVQLADGTRVWLNADTQIRYPVSFRKDQPREVELVYGEAYFEVTSSEINDGASFIVTQNQQKIEVLGTQFNINAYSENNLIYTTLVEGSIAINTSRSSSILKPGQQALNKVGIQDLEIIAVETSYATAWKDGFFMFQDETLSSMMQQLSRWYDVKVEFVNTEKQNYTFSGSLKRTDHIEKLLRSLEQTGEVEFEIKNKTIMIK
ncbi:MULTISPECIES: FecR domain-containing protein [unclassified Leeuwenhoekiella]|uniref:FecR family protein n=1 Tax=unclassified Leeuwenhoekiella TaxID=2615029 RepID=UPI000C380854|nr:MULTISPECIES: FecR domain-containing protein [unclassified Leeuwenhoekiella]MAW95408.1 hypothetical protein [Leeuwenhoekiella sp.]MBA80795.1 hypothetical protein [Leeuwenhoekiella sp.]|tara:strand:+ start:28543 stop:29703 length:1161 start_codon:yes stop_codon:yes gene_type:complete